MVRSLKLLLPLLIRSIIARWDLLLENPAMRQQLAVLKQRHPRSHLAVSGRVFWMRKAPRNPRLAEECAKCLANDREAITAMDSCTCPSPKFHRPVFS